MPSDLLLLLGLFPLTAAGTAWPLAARLELAPAEKAVAGVMLSLLIAYLFAWAGYLLALPIALLWVLPGLGATGLLAGGRALATVARDPVVRTLVPAQVGVTLWCVGWLFLVPSYSGGMWLADWFGHWDRTVFFLAQLKGNYLFYGFDRLTSRPPLVNVLAGALLGDRAFFAGFQLALTLLGSLAFLPAALLAHRWGGRRAIAGLAVLAMLNPAFLQNATYAWTKLPAAFFLLTALYFFLRARDATPPAIAPTLAAVALALAILAHYSAVPYAVLLVAGWWLLRPGSNPTGLPPRAIAGAAMAGALVLATWFGWTLASFGFAGTFLTNTTVTDIAPSPGAQLQTMALNLRDTIVPHFLRAVDFTPLAQTSVSGWWRDWFFQLYQLNVFFMLGSAGWLVVLRELRRAGAGVAPARRRFWLLFVAGSVVLGVVVHSGRNPWGLAHICLQPLVLLGLAFLAGRWAGLGRGWQRWLVAGVTLDGLLGVLLHFGVQGGFIDRWLVPADPADGVTPVYSLFAQRNLEAKLAHQYVFAGDFGARHAGPVAAGLAVLLVAALVPLLRPAASPVPRSP